MEPAFLQWLTSTFGDQAPQVAASMGLQPPQPGVPPPQAAMAQAPDAPLPFASRFGAISDNPREAAAMEFGHALPEQVPLPTPRPQTADEPPPPLGVSLGLPTPGNTGIRGVAPLAEPPAGPATPPPAAEPPPAAAQAQGGMNPLAQALKGVVAPTVPAAQRVSTPSAPRTNDIKGGELLALLLAASEGGSPGGRKINPLPATLGQALNAPRY